MGPSQWPTEVNPHRSHQCCQSTDGQPSTTLPVFCWRGQASQVLGPGVQQGKLHSSELKSLYCRVRHPRSLYYSAKHPGSSALPRSLECCLLHVSAPNHRCTGNWRTGFHSQGKIVSLRPAQRLGYTVLGTRFKLRVGLPAAGVGHAYKGLHTHFDWPYEHSGRRCYPSRQPSGTTSCVHPSTVY